jgi:hypothetical protein
MKKNIDIVRDYLNGERPYIKVGYTGDVNKYIIRKVGERWTDSSGKEWEQKDYGPVAVTRVSDIIREEMEQRCTCCNREIRWGDRHDKKMYYKTKKCFDCLIEEETMLRIKGKFKLYETKKLIENELSYLNDVKKKLKEAREYLSSEDSKKFTYVNSNGLVEEWDNNARAELAENIENDWKTCLKKIKSAEKELKKVNEEIDKTLTAK